MKRASCNFVEERLADYLTGDLPDEESSAIAVHLAVCDDCAESEQIWRGLEPAVRTAELEPLAPETERRVTSGMEPIDLAWRRRRHNVRRAALVAAPLAAAATVALVLALGVEAPGDDPDHGGKPILAVGGNTVDEAPEWLTPLCGAGGSGSQVIDVAPGTRLVLGQEAEAHVELVGANEVRFRLERGAAVAEVGLLPPGFRFVVATPAGEVEARGTLFAVEVAPEGAHHVRVSEGVVEVRSGRALRSRATSLLVAAGQELTPDAPAPRQMDPTGFAAYLPLLEAPERPAEVARAETGPPLADAAASGSGAPVVEEQPEQPASGVGIAPIVTALREGRLTEAAALVDREIAARPNAQPTIDALVKLAQAYRRARMNSAAAEAYARLQQLYPSSRTATNALIGMGQLKLTSMGRPAEALMHFDRYLARAPGGALAKEASVGRVRALARLGRCAEAREGHRRIEARWPGSNEAARAAASLAACAAQP